MKRPLEQQVATGGAKGLNRPRLDLSQRFCYCPLNFIAPAGHMNSGTVHDQVAVTLNRQRLAARPLERFVGNVKLLVAYMSL